MTRRARLFVVSGPSGVGKGTLVARVRDRLPELGLTVSATTRKPRPGETDGVSYYFLDADEFDRRVEAGEFLEWAWVHGERYGTLRSEVDRWVLDGHSVVLEIDVQGGMSVRKAYPDAVLVFVEPPSGEELERRLRGRATEDEDQVALRLSDAQVEMELADAYDEIIVDDDLEEATRELTRIIQTYESDGGPF